MKDVWLDYFKDKKDKVLRLRSGDKLEYKNGLFLNSRGEYIASLSAKMRTWMEEMKEYTVSDAQVSYVLAWLPKEETEEVAVCLANMILTKQQ
jgi:ATP-dependent DNA helicase RecQ